MITRTKKQAARKLMEQQGYENIQFQANGDVTATRDGVSVVVINAKDPWFELEYGRYTVVDGQGYESTAYHTRSDARREAAHLTEATGIDHWIADVLE